MNQESIVIPIRGSLKREAVLAVLHASTAHFPAALAAAKRYAIRDGLSDLTEEDLRAALTALHTMAMRGILELVSPSTDMSEGE